MKPVIPSTVGWARSAIVASIRDDSSIPESKLLSIDQCSAGIAGQQACCAAQGDLLLLASLYRKQKSRSVSCLEERAIAGSVVRCAECFQRKCFARRKGKPMPEPKSCGSACGAKQCTTEEYGLADKTYTKGNAQRQDANCG